MNFSLGDAISLLGVLSPLLFPLAAMLVGRVTALLPQNRQEQLAKAAQIVVTGVQQQANGGWTNEEKYAAAEQGLSMLAAKFGYKVTVDEARVFIESAVAVMKAASAVAAPSPDAGVPNGAVDASQTPVPAGAQ